MCGKRSQPDARVVGVIPQGGLCYILADQGQEWCYVESGDVRGFDKKRAASDR